MKYDWDKLEIKFITNQVLIHMQEVERGEIPEKELHHLYLLPEQINKMIMARKLKEGLLNEPPF